MLQGNIYSQVNYILSPMLLEFRSVIALIIKGKWEKINSVGGKLPHLDWEEHSHRWWASCLLLDDGPHESS